MATESEESPESGAPTAGGSGGSAPDSDAAESPASPDGEASDGEKPAGDDPAPVVAHVPAQATPVHESTGTESPRAESTGTESTRPGTTRTSTTTAATTTDAGPGPVADDAGGRLTARLREARLRLQPEQTLIPAPRTPEGVVPPAPFGRSQGAPPADLLRAVDELAAQLAELEQENEDQLPDRRALLRALDRSAGGVPDGGWSGADRIDADALVGASALAMTLHDTAAALVERLDAEKRAGSAVEVDAVATALQVARMVLDLEGFARHGR